MREVTWCDEKIFGKYQSVIFHLTEIFRFSRLFRPTSYISTLLLKSLVLRLVALIHFSFLLSCLRFTYELLRHQISRTLVQENNVLCAEILHPILDFIRYYLTNHAFLRSLGTINRKRMSEIYGMYPSGCEQHQNLE